LAPREDRGGRRGAPTERERGRASEEERYTPVIVKRTDEARRHPDDILQNAIETGHEQLRREALSLLLSAVAAGLILTFTAMSAAVAATVSEGWSPLVERLLKALVYPLGFVICIMSGAELFTEHTATAVYPVLDGRASAARLVRLWILVAAGNLIGALCGAALLTVAEPVVGSRAGYGEIGLHLVGYAWGPLLASAVLAGWLMALGAWLILATPPASSQIAVVYIVTFLIGLGELHHSIAGAVEIFAARFMTDGIGAWPTARFLLVALVGNLLGGSLFVAVLNYAHIRKTRGEGDRGDEVRTR